MNKFLALLFIFTFVANTAHANDKDKEAAQNLAKFAIKFNDTNKDKKISKEEASAKPNLSKNFAAIDVNGDGFLDEAELAKRFEPKVKNGEVERAFKESSKKYKSTTKLESSSTVTTKKPGDFASTMADSIFRTKDTNKDLLLSREELAKRPVMLKRFDQYDANKDNFLSKEETQSYYANLSKKIDSATKK